MTKKTSVTQGIRAANQLIITLIFTVGHQSIRKLARLSHLSKSSVHRHSQAQTRRNQHPESSFWETTELGNLVGDIAVTTYHQLKGLEFDHVIIMSLHDSQYPGHQPFQGD